MESIVKRLKQSPLFNLSLANKELFHSNFIAWIAEKYPQVFTELIKAILAPKEIELPDNIKVEREYKHFDISVFDENNELLLIIENKIKSIPTVNQLKQYEKEIERYGNVECILLTMTEYCQNGPINGDLSRWTVVDYITLSKNIKNYIKQIQDAYHRALVMDYCDYVSCLQQFIEKFDNNDFLYDPSYLKRIGIHDIVGKRKVHTAYMMLRNYLEQKQEEGVINIVDSVDELKRGAKHVFVNWAYTNAPLLEIKFKSQHDDLIIIQIQGKQYRHAVEIFDDNIDERISRDNKGEYHPNDRGLSYLKNKYPEIILEDRALRNYPIEPQKFGQRSLYCKYCNGLRASNGKINCFVYQWVELPESIQVKDLVSFLVKDLLDLLALSSQ